MSGAFKWDPYFIARGSDVSGFWKGISEDRDGRVLYILGRGFDPRTTDGVKLLMESEYRGICDCLSITMEGVSDQRSELLQKLSDSNFKSLELLIAGRGSITEAKIETWSGDLERRERTGPDRALRLFSRQTIEGYTDVVLDVSALPRGLYFPMLARLISLCSENCTCPSLHVFVAEDPSLDSRIEESGLDEDAYFVPPFRAGMELTSDSPIIWMPLLGEKQQPQVALVQSLVRRYTPDLEVCPVLPLPSRDPRRADSLIRHFSEFLASGWENDSRNFLYVAEQNPFQTYRQLVHSARQFNDALQSIGGCRTVISSHSSKLLSVGATLAAFELRSGGMQVGLANVDATAYTVNPPSDSPFEQAGVMPHVISLTGVAYAN